MDIPPVREDASGCCAISARLDAISGELERVRSADRTMASDEQRLSWIERVRRLQRQVDAFAVILVGEADEASSAMRARHSHLQDWLARSGQETTRQASATLWGARQLERRPEVRDAAASGQITLSQAKAINVALDGLPATLDSEQRRRAETLMLAAAEHTPPETLRGMTEKVLAQVVPQQDETPEARAERLTQRDVRAAARRHVRFGAECDGSVDFSGSLPVVDARRFQHLVQSVADRGYRAAKDTHDRRGLLLTPQQRLADALAIVVTAVEGREGLGAGASGGATAGVGPGVAGGPTVGVGAGLTAGPAEDGKVARLPRGTAPRGSIPGGATRISVVMSADDLLDRAMGRGLLADGTELSPGELRRLACGAELVPVVLGTESTVLDVGYAHRLAPWHVRHAVGLRDGMCAFPGCTAPLEHCDIHHIVPGQEGGPTNVSNLVASCRSHHGLIEPAPPLRDADGRFERVDQWEVRIDGRGLPEFVPPAAMDPHRRPVRRRASHVQELLDTG
jgi:hypothetical protein